MIWWQWIVLGAVLLCAEMFVDAEFFLVFLGVSAVTMGLLGLALPLPFWSQWLLFAALSVAFLLLFREKLYRKIRGTAPDVEEGVVGDFAIAEEEIAPGALGRVQLRGATWTARNTGGRALRAEGRARVVSAEGLQVKVRPED